MEQMKKGFMFVVGTWTAAICLLMAWMIGTVMASFLIQAIERLRVAIQ